MPELPTPRRNRPGTDTYNAIAATNLNRPMHELVCPTCEAVGAAKHYGGDHPGVFRCRVCKHEFFA